MYRYYNQKEEEFRLNWMMESREEKKEKRAYICDDGDAQVSHVGDDLTVLRWDLSVLDQLVQILLRNALTYTHIHKSYFATLSCLHLICSSLF